jgi:hypothetical protein
MGNTLGAMNLVTDVSSGVNFDRITFYNTCLFRTGCRITKKSQDSHYIVAIEDQIMKMTEF